MNVVQKLRPQFIIDPNGQKKAVILPVDKYEELLEDLEDLAAAAERREEKTLSHDQLVKEIS
ncbi:hypothetical protein [Candidatus Electrothrix sp.]|uniref:hypothetical protein n=1 Tax=Candidatus Electrothrix sp. TaxID=2170559 RepID=UPI004057B596